MADYLGKKIKFNIEDNDLQKIRFNKVYGESTQETRSGKNYFDASQIPSSTNIVVSDNGKTITMPIATSGGGATPTTKKLSQLCPKLKVGDTAILRFNRNLGTTKNMYIYLNVVNLTWNINSPKAITQEMLDSYVSLFANRYDDGETGQCILTDFSIMLSSETDTSWEPYGASPSPDYPSEIENLEGKNKFNYLWFDTTKEVDWTVYQSITSLAKAIPIFIGKGKAATFSSNVPLLSGDNLLYAINDLTKNTNASFALGKTQTVEANNEGYVYVGYIKSRTNYNKVKDGTYYVQVEEGTVATPYVPYNSLEFKDEGENLFNIDTIIENSYIIAQNGDRGNSSFTNTSDYIPINANEKYVITYDYTSLLSENTRAVCFFDKNKNYVNGKTYSVTSKKVDVSSDFDGYVVFSYDKNCTYIMFSKEEQSIQYEPYKQQTEYFPLSEGQKLYKNSYLADGGIHHSRKQVVFDGSDDENWTQNGSNQGYGIEISDVGGGGDNTVNKVLCDKLTPVTQAQIFHGVVENAVASIGGIRHKLYVRFDSSITTVALLREKLAESPILIEYELAEEEIVPYTETQQEAREKLRHFKGLNGENNITAQGTMTSTLDLTLYNVAEEDFDIYISKKGYFGALKYDINNLIDFTESNIPSIAEATESSVKIAGRDGDISLNTVYEPLPFEIVCYTEDNLTPEEKIVEEQKVTSLLNSIKNQTKTFFMEREKKFYKVKYSGNLSVVRYPKHLKFTIPLKSSESYAMNFEESEIIGNGTKVSNTIKDTGAIFTIKGPATKPIISLNNYQMKYNENILEGNSLIINSEDSTITHITSAGVKTNAMRAYNHEFPKIKNGENQLAVSSGIDDENQVNVKWYDLKI